MTAKYRETKGARKSVARIAYLLAGTAFSFASATVGHAQESLEAQADGELGDIVVTAQRRSENLQDVPVTISAFNSEQLNNFAVTKVDEIGTLTPGLTFTSTVGYALPYLRGIGSATTGPGFENPVAMYVDGVYLASQSGGMMSLSNIEAIEVDKGPQGTLFGRNATAGAIQVRTLTPSQDFGGKISASYGNYDTVSGNLYLTTGVSDTGAIDFSAYYSDQGDGYGQNLFTGNDFSKARELALRSKLVVDLTDMTKVTIIADYSKSQDKPALLPAPGTTPPAASPVPSNPRDGYGATDPYMTSEQWGTSLKVDQEIGQLSLMSISAYRELEFEALFLNTLTSNLAGVNAIHTIEPHRQFSQELQLQSPKGDFEWILGAYYFHERAGYGRTTELRGGLAGGGAGIDSLPDSKVDSYAAFGQATYSFGPATKLTAGLRYTSEKKYLSATTILRAATPAPTTLPAVVQSDTFNKLTWRIALTHELSDAATLFASYNRGFKSGGFNSAVVQSYAPETLDAYEAGIKTNLFDRHLRLNVAGFYYDYSNIQVTSFVSGRQTVNNGGAAKLYGVDVDFEAALTPELTISGGGEWLHAEFTDFANALISSPAIGGGTVFTPIANAAGHDLPRAPKVSFNLGANYTKELDFGKVSASVVWSYNDGFYAQADNRLRQPAYHLVNATLGVELENGLGLSVWGKNLNNARYAVALGARGAGDFIQYAAPRTYGVTAKYKF